MRLTHKTIGLEDVQKTFQGLSKAVTHAVAIAILKDAAEPIRSRAAALAPRGPGDGPHLADNIITAETTRVPGRGGKWRDVEAHEHVVAIGPSYQPHDVFYGMFQELGTVRAPAQPYLRPAFDEGHRSALRIIKQGLQEIYAHRLGRAVRPQVSGHMGAGRVL